MKLLGAVMIVSSFGAAGLWSILGERRQLTALEAFCKLVHHVIRDLQSLPVDRDQLIARAVGEVSPVLVEDGHRRKLVN